MRAGEDGAGRYKREQFRLGTQVKGVGASGGQGTIQGLRDPWMILVPKTLVSHGQGVGAPGAPWRLHREQQACSNLSGETTGPKKIGDMQHTLFLLRDFTMHAAY